MPSFHKSIHDLTDKAIPALFFFVVVGSVTVVLTYSNGFKEPVPRDVTIGLTATLGILVFLFALGRTFLYFKGTVPPEPDVEQISIRSRLHPTMAPMQSSASPTSSTRQHSNHRRGDTAVAHTAPYPEGDTMVQQSPLNTGLLTRSNAMALQDATRMRQHYVDSPPHPSQPRNQREVDPYHPYEELPRLQPYETPTRARTRTRSIEFDEVRAGRSGGRARPSYHQRQLGRVDARRELPSAQQRQVREDIAVNNALVPGDELSLRFPLLSFLVKHALVEAGPAPGDGNAESSRTPCRHVPSGSPPRRRASAPLDRGRDPGRLEARVRRREGDDVGSQFSRSTGEAKSPCSDGGTNETLETCEHEFTSRV